jgi:hypothetical protein
MTDPEEILQMIDEAIEELNHNGKDFKFYCKFVPNITIFEIGIDDEELNPVLPFKVCYRSNIQEQIEDFVLMIRSREFYERELEKFWSGKELDEMQNKGDK